MLKGRLIEDEYIAQRRANEVDDQAEQPLCFLSVSSSSTTSDPRTSYQVIT